MSTDDLRMLLALARTGKLVTAATLLASASTVFERGLFVAEMLGNLHLERGLRRHAEQAQSQIHRFPDSPCL